MNNATPHGDDLAPEAAARIEVRVNGKLMVAVSVTTAPADADEVLELLAAARLAADGDGVPDPELV